MIKKQVFFNRYIASFMKIDYVEWHVSVTLVIANTVGYLHYLVWRKN